MDDITTADFEASLSKYMPFLVEIRKRLLFIFSVFLVTSVIGFIYYEKIVSFLLKIFSLDGVNIVFTSPFQFFNLALTSAALLAVIAVFPLITYQVLAFLRPALNSREHRTIISLLPLSLLLFVSGFGFGAIIMKYVIMIFYEKSTSLNVGNFLDISLLLSQILITALLMGLAFQFPIILTILMRLKVIKYKFLVQKRIFIYGLSLVFAILLPPTDLLSLFLLFLPLALLFELTLLLNRWVLKSHIL